MKIKWLGHSCFLFTSENGTRVLTDPFDDQVGYRLPEEEADIATTSHDHFDHNFVKTVKGKFIHVNGSGKFNEKGVGITGILSFHDEEHGSKRGSNIIYIFDIDGMKICHCGDLGHIPGPQQVQEIGKIDILLLPVGGVYTIDAKAAVEVMKLLKPSITIPMHFMTEELSFSLDGVNRFLAAAGGGEVTGKQELQIGKEDLSKLSSILVMNYK